MSRSASSSFQFVCRQCRNALKRRPGQERQQFSTTRQLDSRALPTFEPTSSPELDTLLSTIRMKYFLPQYLNEHQRKLIRSDKLKSQLEHDPVYATLGSEEIRLEHLDFTQDIPSRAAFRQVIALLQDRKDWLVLPGLLEGYHRSKAKLDPHWLGSMIKTAREAGTMNMVIQCLSQVKKNGFSLSIPSVREQILLGIRQNAKEAGWDIEGTKSLQKAEEVLRHMENPDHCGSRKVAEADPRAEPYVIAVPLELAAQQALKAGNDDTGKVEIYSTRLIAALAQQKSELNDDLAWKIPENATTPIKSVFTLNALDLLVAKYTAVYSALKLAEQVRGQSWSEDERAFANHLQTQIEQKLDFALDEAAKVAASGLEIATPALDEWRQTAKH